MHLQRLTISILLFFIATVILQAQQNKKNKEQAKYLSSYEDKTLSPTVNSPMLLPYNRWIDPAGIQIYFGAPNLENHALDVALSPDQKWLAVEGRYEVVIVSPMTKKNRGHSPNERFHQEPECNEHLFRNLLDTGRKSLPTILGCSWQHSEFVCSGSKLGWERLIRR